MASISQGSGSGSNYPDDKRSNQTHESTTDPDARLYEKSYDAESKLAYLGHVLVENRNGLIAAATVNTADGDADAALRMLADKQEDRSRRITPGADKACDAEDFVRAARALNVTPHITKNDTGPRTNMDRSTHPASWRASA